MNDIERYRALKNNKSYIASKNNFAIVKRFEKGRKIQDGGSTP